jgi:hypothetical protein
MIFLAVIFMLDGEYNSKLYPHSSLDTCIIDKPIAHNSFAKHEKYKNIEVMCGDIDDIEKRLSILKKSKLL